MGVWALVTGATGTSSFIKQTAVNVSRAAAYVNALGSDVVVFTSGRPFANGGSNISVGSAGRITIGSSGNAYWARLKGIAAFDIVKIVAAAETILATTAVTASDNEWVSVMLALSGTSIYGEIIAKGVRTTLSVTDSAVVNTNNAGAMCSGNATAGQTDSFDYITICTSDVITINGLLDGQKFKLYKNGVLAGTSGQSLGGTATFTIRGNATDYPPYDQIVITDTDGSTVVYTFTSTANIFGGDTYTAVASQNPLKNPPFAYPFRTQRPRLFFFTKNKVYRDIIIADAYPPAGNTLGSFRLVIPDPNRTEAGNFSQYERLWLVGKTGSKAGHILKGVVDRVTPIRLQNGYWVLEVIGRDTGAFLDIRRHSSQVVFSNAEISQIIKDTAAGPGVLVPEIVFGNYVYNTGITLTSYTVPRGMSAFDLLKELAALATTPTTQWGVFVDQGEFAGDNGAPNLHFHKINQGVGLLTINTLKTFRTTAPLDYRQLISRVTMGYDSGAGGNLPNAYSLVDGYGPGIVSAFSANFGAAIQSASGVWASGSTFTVTFINTPVSTNIEQISIIVTSTNGITVSSIASTGATWTKQSNYVIGNVDTETWSATGGTGKIITVTLSGTPAAGSTGTGAASEVNPGNFISIPNQGQLNFATPAVTFSDSEWTPKTVTPNGGATIDSTQSKFGGGSVKLVAASSQNLSVPDSTDWAFGVADSTILDCWVMFNSLPTNGNTMYLWRQRQDGTNEQAAFIFNNAGTYQLGFFASSGSTLINSSKNTNPNLVTGTWYHLAIARSGGNTFTYFQGGTSLGTTSNSSNLPDYAATLNIGGVASSFLDGWIDEFRISNTARWTSNFTPPTAPYTADANTVLLLHLDPPTAPITIEGWFYPSTVNGSQTIACKGRPNADANNANYGLRLNGPNFEFYYSATGTTAINNIYTTSGTALQANRWYYICLTFTFGTSNSIKIYCGGNDTNSTYPDVTKLYLQKGAWTTGTGGTQPAINTYPLTQGGVKTDGTMLDIFSGYIDSVKIYPRAITQLECLQHYRGTFMKGYTVLDLQYEENGIPNTSAIVDSSGYGNNGTQTGLAWFNYNNVPNSQATYGIISRYFDRTYAGLAEANNFGTAILRLYRQPQRFVEIWMPLDMRWTPGQYVNIIDKAFRGRALLKEVRHIYDDNPRSELTLLYL